MKLRSIVFIVLICVLVPGVGYAYYEETDNILSSDENAIYMIGSVYNRLTESTIKSKEDSFRIYKIDLASNRKVIFYEVNKSTIDSLILSQDNKYIAVTRGEKYPKTEIVVKCQDIVDPSLMIKSVTTSLTRERSTMSSRL